MISIRAPNRQISGPDINLYLVLFKTGVKTYAFGVGDEQTVENLYHYDARLEDIERTRFFARVREVRSDDHRALFYRVIIPHNCPEILIGIEDTKNAVRAHTRLKEKLRIEARIRAEIIGVPRENILDLI